MSNKNKSKKSTRIDHGDVWESLSDKVTAWVGSVTSLIIHTLFFAGALLLILLGFETDKVLLVLTTVVSLEAIYLSILIQMTVNRHTESLEDVGEDIEGISEEVKEISEDVEDISEEVKEISEDVEDISEDVEDISEDVEEIQGTKEQGTQVTVETIEKVLQKAIQDLEKLKK